MEDYFEDLISENALLKRSCERLSAEINLLKSLEGKSESARLKKKIKKLENRIKSQPVDQLLDSARLKSLEEENVLLKGELFSAECAIKILKKNMYEILRVHDTLMKQPELKKYMEHVLGIKHHD